MVAVADRIDKSLAAKHGKVPAKVDERVDVEVIKHQIRDNATYEEAAAVVNEERKMAEARNNKLQDRNLSASFELRVGSLADLEEQKEDEKQRFERML